MTEPDELQEPSVTETPEPDQEPHEPIPDEAETTVEEEAEEAETGVQEPAEPAEGEGEDEAPPEAPAQASAGDEAGIEKAYKALAKEASRHANRIGEIMGEDAQMLLTCPRCVTTDPQRPPTPGFIWPHEVMPLLPEDKAKVKLSIGEGAEIEYREADDASRCPKCDGRGKVKTGSQVPNQERLKCLECDGRGWIGARMHKVELAPTNNVPELVAVGAGVVEPQPQTDPWGRLRDDPLFGVVPGFERD